MLSGMTVTRRSKFGPDPIDRKEKRCSDCGETKPLSEFTKSKQRADGRGRQCRPCHAARQRAYNQRNRRLVNMRKQLAKWGLTVETYEELLESQGGRCAICGSADNGDARNDVFNVDHCHETGAIRGLLCSPCNRGLGQFGDSVDRLERAIVYLRGSSGCCQGLGA